LDISSFIIAKNRDRREGGGVGAAGIEAPCLATHFPKLEADFMPLRCSKDFRVEKMEVEAAGSDFLLFSKRKPVIIPGGNLKVDSP
jgi:hypothetical protein